MRPTNVSLNSTTMRTASGIDDFWRVRQLLIDSWQHLPPFFNWETRRWDGAYFHDAKPGFSESWGGAAGVALWEDGGRVVAAVHPEGGRGDAWLQVHPDYRWLEPAMLEWAEEHLARPGKDGRLRLLLICWEDDEQCLGLLNQRGYTRTAHGEVVREKPYRAGLPPAPHMPEGYTLHCVRPGNREDCERYAALINDAFQRTFHRAEDLLTFTTQSPSFSSELELAAVAPDGRFAALTGMIYDEDNRFGSFEPVCATRGPRPLGLVAALMAEGYRRVRELGAEHCYTGTGIGMAANRFYEACGFKIIRTGWYWEKVLDG